MKLQNQKVIVTGGAGGYGKGIAKAFKDAGAQVWITGRNVEKLKKTSAELDVNFIAADISKPEDWDKVFNAVPDVDILVNNAGAGGKISPVAEQLDEDIISTININLTGTILGCRRAAKIMTARKSGMIFNISSVCALYAWPAWSVYTAAKAGLAKFSHGLHTELRPYNVRVFCVTPSWGQTDFNNAAGIRGASEDPEMSKKCTSPDELGCLIRQLAETPEHLAVPDITIQPMIQDICPM